MNERNELTEMLRVIHVDGMRLVAALAAIHDAGGVSTGTVAAALGARRICFFLRCVGHAFVLTAPRACRNEL